MSDVTMTDNNEEEKIPKNVAPTPSASHNPKCKTTGDENGFQATKSSKMFEMTNKKDASDILKMSKISEMAITLKNAYSDIDLTNLHESPSSSKEKVAVAEISTKCQEFSTSPKVMGLMYTAGSAHSVSEVRQINMAGNI